MPTRKHKTADWLTPPTLLAAANGCLKLLLSQNKSGAVALIFCVGGMTVLGAEPGRVVLHGHVPAAVAGLTPKGRLPATNQLHLAIGLPLRDPAGLDRFLADVYDPASPNYRHFLTPAEFTARFSATEADYAAVKNFALTNGFKISGEYGNRILLDVTARAADVERAFHLKLNKFKHPTEAREFFAPDVEPTVDAVLPVVDVQGLSDYSKPHPKFRKMDPNTVAPKNGSGSGGTYLGDDFRNAYAPGVTLTGAGQQVGLFQLDGYYANDIATYAQQAGGGRTNIQVQTVPVGSTNWSIGVNGGNPEVSLDIEMAMAMAPGLSKILVFEGPSSAWPNDVLNAMATSNTVKNLSSSWGWSGGPVTSTDNIFKNMAAQGQSFFNASGDSDAFVAGSNNDVDNSSQANAPSGSPYITQVGGTVLTTGTGALYSSEAVWNDRTVNPHGGNWGSSGGITTYYSIPSWQTNISMTANQGSTTQRNIPDVALTAINVYVYEGNGLGGSYGGTSCAAPLWAGFMALVNQQAAILGNPPAGFINPAVYAIGEGLNPLFSYAACFHDTTSGDNSWSSSAGKYPAVAGYDLCTGWGTPAGTNLIYALAGVQDSLVITPASGFSASGVIGGPFAGGTQVFSLTNSSGATLNWSIINTSAWLNVSSSSGTLAAVGQTTVTISLNSAANSLAVGSYSATVGFSNLTSHVLQNPQFTLQINDPLVLLTTNGFTAYGAAGGPFSPSSQAVVFTNLSASPVAWSFVNTSSWLSVSASSGSVAGDGSASVTVATNASTATLAIGVYAATLVLSNQSSHLAQNLPFSASVGQSIVQNGGFETGDFTSWSLSGNSSLASVSSSSSYFHFGNYGMRATTSGTFGYISQNMPTAPGQTYQLSFWFYNRNGSSGEQLQAFWNGTSIYSISSLPATWTNQKLIVTATGTSTQLQFGFLTSSSSYRFGLDDISVTPVNLPAITQQPISQTNLVGSNVTFTAAASGTAPLGYQWRTNGVNLANGGVISGVATSTLTLTAITINNAGSYSVVVTNAYGSITSSVAALTVVLPPSIVSSSVTNRAVECGKNTNTFAITAGGTAPLAIQWNTNGVPVIGATNASFVLTNLHLLTITNVAVTVTNLYGGAMSNAVVTVIDSLPPVITLNGTNPVYVELGSTFTDPGATANDTCAGSVSVFASGAVNTSLVGTNTLTYTANDGNGNTNTATRTVVVRDTTPPTILWSFTNLVLAANTNCNLPMPNVTGTNFILATDLSMPLTVSQNPTNNFILPLGTNAVVIAVADAYGNTAYFTNTVVVQDQTPPLIFGGPQSQTNLAGTTASFSFAATACTPLTFQWYSNSVALALQTNSTLTLSNVMPAAGNYFAVATASGGSSTSAVVTLTVTLPPPVISSVAANPNGSFTLQLAGLPGYTYILEATTNLFPPGNWLPLTTNTLGTNSVWQFNDPSAVNFPQQFYRLRLAQ